MLAELPTHKTRIEHLYIVGFPIACMFEVHFNYLAYSRYAECSIFVILLFTRFKAILIFMYLKELCFN